MVIYGGYLIIISSGLRSSGLFFLINVIYKQINKCLIFVNKNIINFIPTISFFWFIICSSNIGSPVH